jgi:hypothetical protein
VDVPFAGRWRVDFDTRKIGGAGREKRKKVLSAAPVKEKERAHAVRLDLPPLGAVVLKRVAPRARKAAKKEGKAG